MYTYCARGKPRGSKQSHPFSASVSLSNQKQIRRKIKPWPTENTTPLDSCVYRDPSPLEQFLNLRTSNISGWRALSRGLSRVCWPLLTRYRRHAPPAVNVSTLPTCPGEPNRLTDKPALKVAPGDSVLTCPRPRKLRRDLKPLGNSVPRIMENRLGRTEESCFCHLLQALSKGH